MPVATSSATNVKKMKTSTGVTNISNVLPETCSSELGTRSMLSETDAMKGKTIADWG